MVAVFDPPYQPVAQCRIPLTGSKSESNRWQILKAMYPRIQLGNLSGCDDVQALKHALNSGETNIDIGHAGTAMRFATAYFAHLSGKTVVLKGSTRMHQRPIGILVDALRQLGATIDYLEEEGYPPLQIHGQEMKGGEVAIEAGVSSQYLSAILLIAAQLEEGLHLRLLGKPTSTPYLMMTLKMLTAIGIAVTWGDLTTDKGWISVRPLSKVQSHQVQVEADWSSASYWYSVVGFQEVGCALRLIGLEEDSWQADRRIAKIFESFGVQTVFDRDGVLIKKISATDPLSVHFDLRDCPDIAQTIFAYCLGKQIDLQLTGLHTLRIKETDRLQAMKEVGMRFRESEIVCTPSSISLQIPPNTKLQQNVRVDTYKDHRMAMAFAPLGLLTSIKIVDPEVVSKSYPQFFNDLQAFLGKEIKFIPHKT